jgi:hypothetical protein
VVESRRRAPRAALVCIAITLAVVALILLSGQAAGWVAFFLVPWTVPLILLAIWGLGRRAVPPEPN